MKNRYLIIFSLLVLLTSSSFAVTWSLSKFEITDARIAILIKTMMNTEIEALEELNLFYKDKILVENQKKHDNVIKLIKLNAEESLLVGELILIDQRLKKVLELDHE